MISIALRNLFGEKTRFLISVGGVAFSVMLILIILSLYRGWQIKSVEYIKNVGNDIWVTQANSADMNTSASIIPTATADQIEKIDGVEEVDRFIGKPLQVEIKDKTVNLYIIGYDINKKIAGPKKIVEGRSNPKGNEIVLDQVLARNHQISLGDYITIFSIPFEVVGITQGANMFLFQFGFIEQQKAARIFKMDNLATYYLVNVKNSKTDSVVSDIKNISGIDALSTNDFAQKNKEIIDEVFMPIILVLVAISILVGTAVIGLTIYTATVEKSREFGVLKALGGSNMQIYRIIFEQALVSGFIGYFLGVGLTYFVLWLIPQYVSVFVTVTLMGDLIMVFAISMVMSLVASYTPVRRIVKIDPALVFKS